MIVQGREVTDQDVEFIKQLIENNPSWHRTRLSKEICVIWNWCTTNGQIKDMACRTYLRKLEQRGYITLPKSRQSCVRKRKAISNVPHKTDDIICCLNDLKPLRIEIVDKTDNLKLFKCLLHEYHYLGFGTTVGENIKYMVFDHHDNPLCCLLFGSAAWYCASRDIFIGWDDDIRKAKLQFTTNNTRFLILPWVKVPHLASHILGVIARRISSDWVKKYGHPIYMLETFVELHRFRGTCYQAANWLHVGMTEGRGRNNKSLTVKVPVKDIYLYPLIKNYREMLCHE